MRKIYVAYDGKEFTNPEECLEYESMMCRTELQDFRNSILAYDIDGNELEIPELLGMLPTEPDEEIYEEIRENETTQFNECCNFAEDVIYIYCFKARVEDKFRQQLYSLGELTGFIMDLPEDEGLSSGIYKYDGKWTIVTPDDYKKAKRLVTVCDKINQETPFGEF